MAQDDHIGPGRELLPDLDRFSEKAIQRAVRNESVLHPLTLYPTALGMLSGLAALLYDLPLLLLGMGGLLAVGATTSVINYFFRDKAISADYLAKVTAELNKRRARVLRTLRKDLQKCMSIRGAETYGVQGSEQFDRVEKKYQRLVAQLGKKFSKTELTYGSYLGAAEQVHLSVLDNLMKVVSLLQGAESIDPAYVDARKKQLQSLDRVTDADEREFEALQKRLKLRENQLQQVNTLLTENEESMTVMDATIAAIANLETGKGLADNDLPTAMQHLREIAQRTRHYQ